MKKLSAINQLKAFVITGIAIISFSHFVGVLFGQTIPNIIWTFFKDASASVIIAAVFLFAIIWFLKTRPKIKPKKYSIVTYDIFGNNAHIDGLRTEFNTHDVAWSFMKQYKKSYPLYSFAMISDLPNSKKQTIFKYI